MKWKLLKIIDWELLFPSILHSFPAHHVLRGFLIFSFSPTFYISLALPPHWVIIHYWDGSNFACPLCRFPLKSLFRNQRSVEKRIRNLAEVYYVALLFPFFSSVWVSWEWGVDSASEVLNYLLSCLMWWQRWGNHVREILKVRDLSRGALVHVVKE